MTGRKDTTIKETIAKMDIKKRVLIGAVGVMALAGLGAGAASAAAPAPAPPSSKAPATTDTSTPETPGAPEIPGDTGPDVEQTGDHTDPGDLPGSP